MTTEQTGWWQRNWKWVVALGCVVSVVLAIGFVGAIFLMVSNSIKQSGAYALGVALAQNNASVRQALGEPVTTGWLTTGSISVSGPSGEASLSIPLEGPDGSATLYVEATKRKGQWKLEFAKVEISDSPDRINLLQASGGSG